MTYDYWFRVPLTCLGCGAVIPPSDTRLYADGMSPDIRGGWVDPGQDLPVELDDFGNAYTMAHDPADAPIVRVVDGWFCPVSNEAQWARLEFERLAGDTDYRFLGASSVPLTADELHAAHFIGRGVAEWFEEQALDLGNL